MKILYDYQIFYNQDFGGISRYFYEILKSYKHDEDFSYEFPIKYSDNLYLKEAGDFKDNIFPKNAISDPFQLFLKGFEFKGKRKLYNLKTKILQKEFVNDLEVNKRLSIEKIKEGNYDVFHPTYYDNYFLDFIGTKPYVITVYDMIHQIFPEYFLKDGIDKSKRLLQKANKIIAISECTKKDLVSIYGIDENKVEITYLANSLLPVCNELNNEFVNLLPVNYLLFVGNREAYKNFYFFIQAYNVLIKEFPDLCVVCTGKPFDVYELNYFNNLGIKNKILHFYIDDTKLSILYQKANVFVFPSMYEGFGIPVLEAFACGCPVVNSNAGSLPEVGGDSAIYFETKDIKSLVVALRKIISNKDYKKQMIAKGYEQLKKFTWEKTTCQTKNIYKNICNTTIK